MPTNPTDYPNNFEYEPGSRTLRVGKGMFASVAPEVWAFSVSGLQVVASWLGYRMAQPAGRSSSLLDGIRPTRWRAQFTEELLEVMWVLEHTIGMFPSVSKVLDEIVAGPTIAEGDLPTPANSEREQPSAGAVAQQLKL